MSRAARSLIALDEFQFIARETPSVGSDQRFGANSNNSNLFPILSGSDVTSFDARDRRLPRHSLRRAHRLAAAAVPVRGRLSSFAPG